MPLRRNQSEEVGLEQPACRDRGMGVHQRHSLLCFSFLTHGALYFSTIFEVASGAGCLLSIQL